MWDGCAEGRKTRGLDLFGACLGVVWLFCKAGSHQSWETEDLELGAQGKTSTKKLPLFLYLLSRASQRRELKGRNCIFQPIVMTLSIESPRLYMCNHCQYWSIP